LSRNGSGVQSSPGASYPAVASTLIESTKFNAVIDDINSVLTLSLAADGQTTVTANIPMNSKKFTGLLDGSARTDSNSLGQVQDGKLNWVAGAGTADVITATYSPAITALVDGQLCCVRATAANATTTPTFAPNGLTARTIVKKGGVALVAGDIEAVGHELILRYLLASTRWELLNPASGFFSGGVSGTQLTSTIATGTAPLIVSSTTEVANLKAATATTATKSTNIAGGLVGQIPYQSAVDTTALLAAGTAGQVLKSGGGAAPSWQTNRLLVQRVSTTSTTASTANTVIPYDNTVPQITEGDQVLSRAITPTNASNILVVKVSVFCSTNSGGFPPIVALFQDSTADAKAAGIVENFLAGKIVNITYEYETPAGSVSATTFTVRLGAHTGGIAYLNSASGSQTLGGVLSSKIIIEEYLP